MIKVYVSNHLMDEEKKKLEAVSAEYSFSYEEDPEAEVIIGNVSPLKLKEFSKLRWIQTNAVGIERYIKDGVLSNDVTLTNAINVHSQEVAEHVLAMILNMVKKLYLYRDDQKRHLWTDENKVKELKDLKVCIVGFGDIGTQLAILLKALGVYVIGVKRKPIEKPACLDELYLAPEMDKAISDVDVVVTLLPGNKENVHLFTLDTFRKMRSDTILINAGRGNLYSENTLKDVLDLHIIQAIASDVFEEEPLSDKSELWDYRNLVITPHVAGSFHLDSAMDRYLDLVVENLKRYINNEELQNIVHERE